MNTKNSEPKDKKVPQNSLQKKRSLLDILYFHATDQFINWRKHVKDWGFAIIFALLIRALLLTIYKIPSGSMIPTFMLNDMLIANRFYYGLKIPFTDGLPSWRLPAFKKPDRGDVVIFRAPAEELYYRIGVNPLSQKGLSFIKEINQASRGKSRPIDLRGGFTNYIFPHGERPQINTPTYTLLHESVYQKYSRQLKTSEDLIVEIYRNPETRQPITERFHMTYSEHKYPGFFKLLYDTPLSGLAIIAGVCINSSFMIPYKYLLISASKKFGWNIVRRGEITLYPNDFVDMTKDYVKRLIALPGDVIEIRNKRVYINGDLLPRTETPVRDTPTPENGSSSANIYKETITTRSGAKKNYPVRFTKSFSIPPSQMSLDSWPYFPLISGQEFKDNFGPLVVPKGHYFVMGDNRDDSLDSRFWGFLPTWAIKGTAMMIFSPRIAVVK